MARRGHIGPVFATINFVNGFYSTPYRGRVYQSEPPQAAEFLQKRLISDLFGFQWQNLAEILSLFKKYNNLRKVAVREKV